MIIVTLPEVNMPDRCYSCRWGDYREKHVYQTQDIYQKYIHCQLTGDDEDIPERKTRAATCPLHDLKDGGVYFHVKRCCNIDAGKIPKHCDDCWYSELHGGYEYGTGAPTDMYGTPIPSHELYNKYTSQEIDAMMGTYFEYSICRLTGDYTREHRTSRMPSCPVKEAPAEYHYIIEQELQERIKNRKAATP